LARRHGLRFSMVPRGGLCPPPRDGRHSGYEVFVYSGACGGVGGPCSSGSRFGKARMVSRCARGPAVGVFALGPRVPSGFLCCASQVLGVRRLK